MVAQQSYYVAIPIKLEGRWDCCSVFVCTLLICIYFSSYGVIMHHSGISTRNYCSLHIIVNDSVQFVISAFYHGCLCYHQDIKCSAHQKVLRATGINAKQSHFKWMKRKEWTGHSLHLIWMILCGEKDGVKVEKQHLTISNLISQPNTHYRDLCLDFHFYLEQLNSYCNNPI